MAALAIARNSNRIKPPDVSQYGVHRGVDQRRCGKLAGQSVIRSNFADVRLAKNL